MTPKTFAHLSDLHFGKSGASGSAAALVSKLREADVDHVIVTGDVTHGGRDAELREFERVFAPFAGRMTVVPGNHDRLNDAPAGKLMDDQRVSTAHSEGLYIVRIDSSGTHNASPLSSHGLLTHDDLKSIDEAVSLAPAEALVILALHHHVHPLPQDNAADRLASALGLQDPGELVLGAELTTRMLGRVDLILHGHRHEPSEAVLYDAPERPLAIYNAGSSTELRKARVFTHCAGLHVRAPQWLGAERPKTERAPVWAALQSISAMFL